MAGIVYYKVETRKNFNSLVQGKALVEFAKKRGMETIGIADNQAMYSVMDFYHEADSSSIKPLIGLQLTVVGRTKEESLPVTFVARNYKGYLELVRLLNTINTANEKTENQKEAKSIIKKKVNLSIPVKDVGMLNHVIATVSYHAVVEQNRMAYIETLMSHLKKRVIEGNLWLELEPAMKTEQKVTQKLIAEYAKKNGFPIIAAPSVRYFDKSDEKVMNVLNEAKKTKKKATDYAAYFLTEEEEQKAFAAYPNAIKQTHVLATMCNVKMPVKGTSAYERKMPEYKVPENFEIPLKILDMFDKEENFSMPKELYKQKQIAYLCSLAWKGFLTDYKEHEEKTKAMNQLKKELGFMIKHDKTNYFLHVSGFVRYAKENHIAIGPGRGSVVGSILAKCLGIIDIDPIAFNLLFERFMNEERIEGDEADIDIDVSKRDRYRLLQYARETYGIYHVAKVVTFNPYGGKRAFELAAKAYDLPKKVVDKLKEKIDKRIEEVMGNESFLADVRKEYPFIDEVLQVASQVQEVPNSKSVHAAAVVLSKYDLRNELPIDMVFDQQLNATIPVIQYTEDNKHLEALGFTKIDLLSLTTLDVIEDTKVAIVKRTGKPMPTMSYEDERVFKIFQKGELVGIFQLGSPEMRDTAVLTKPTTFRDIINLSALYRPGGKDEIPHYVKNRNKQNRVIYDVDGQPIEGVSDLEVVLHRTYGIIVYQEQIMKIAQVWSGYDLGEADVLRRAISKKKKTVLEEGRKQFVSRALKRGRGEDESNKIYDLIVKFADYGFNESHAVGYGRISYEMVFLKTYYPLEFMSALISSVMDEKNKAASYVKEAKRMGLKVMNPSVETSKEKFEPLGDEMVFGLPMIKDVSVKAIEMMVKERNKRPFLSFTDFLNRMHSLDMNKKIMKALIAVGTFDVFGNQPQLLKLLEEKSEPLKLPKRQKLFTDLSTVSYDLIEQLPSLKPWTIEERIKAQEEYACLVLEKSPMETHQFVYMHLLKRINKTQKMFGGVIVGKKVFKDSQKRDMAYLQIQGSKAEVKVVVFADMYEKVKERLGLYQYILFQAKKDDKRNQFILNQVEEVKAVRMLLHYPIEIAQKSSEEQVHWMKSLESILHKHKGSDELILAFRNRKKMYHVNVTDALVKELNHIIKEEAFAFEKVR